MDNKELKQLQDRINSVFDEAMKQAKPQFEVGKVYKHPKHKGMILITAFNDINNVSAYGFDCYGNWHSDETPYAWGCHEFIEATPSEWQEALNKERIRLGIVVGATVIRNFKTILSRQNVKLPESAEDRTNYYPDEDALTFNGWDVYRKGQWAEVVEEPIMVGGEEVRFDEKYMYFNKWRLDKDIIQLFRDTPKEVLDRIIDKMK